MQLAVISKMPLFSLVFLSPSLESLHLFRDPGKFVDQILLFFKEVVLAVSI